MAKLVCVDGFSIAKCSISQVEIYFQFLADDQVTLMKYKVSAKSFFLTRPCQF